MKCLDWTEELAVSFYNVVRMHDASAHRPFNGFNLNPLFYGLLYEKLHEAILKLKKNKVSDELILQALPTHSSLRFILSKFIVAYPYVDFNEKKFGVIIDFMLYYLKLRDQGDLFARQSNRIHSEKEIKDLIKNSQWIEANPMNKKLLANSLLGLTNFVYGLYNDFVTDFGFDAFGPYPLENQTSLLIRSFPDIAPKEVWPKNKFRFKSVEIGTVYKNLDIEIHFLGSHLNLKGNHLEALQKFYVKADGKFLPEEKLKDASEYFLESSATHYAAIKNLPFEEQKKMYVIQELYPFRRLFELIRITWYPEPEFFSAVQNKPLLNIISNYELSFGEFKEQFGFNRLSLILKRSQPKLQ